MSGKKQREDGGLDWLSSNGLPNSTEEKPRHGANLGQGHLFGSICQWLGSFLVRCINEIHSRSFDSFLSPVFLGSCRDRCRSRTATQFRTHDGCDRWSYDCRVEGQYPSEPAGPVALSSPAGRAASSRHNS